MHFQWDLSKAIANKRKHGVCFDEAKTVFFDDFARLISDEDNSEDEDRFILLGLSTRVRLLTVCHCYHEYDDIIRLISSRKETASESKQYGGMPL